MKYLTFAPHTSSQGPRLGALYNEIVIDLENARHWAQAARGLPARDLPGSMVELVLAGPSAWNDMGNMIPILEGVDPLSISRAGSQPVGYRMVDVVLYPPLVRPASLRDFYAFEQHVSAAFANRGRDIPAEWYRFPAFYFTNPNSIYGPGEGIPYPSYTQALDYELEAACVIGIPGRDIPAERAEQHIFGYTIFNDWSARDTGRIHQPPPVHQTFQGQNFVVCSFVPRLFDYHPQGIPAPYNHSNINSDEVIYYAEGDFMSRKGIHRADITLHPSGMPHGPQPGATEASIGKEKTDELAVMVDTFHPLQVAMAALEFEKPGYMQSWMEGGPG